MIPLIDWPFKALSNQLGSSADEIKLIFTFFLSYPLAGVLKRIPDSKPYQKNLFSIGVSLFYLVGIFDLWLNGIGTLAVSAVGAYSIATYLKTSPYMPWIGFIYLMGHMSISHIWRQAANDPGSVDITGAQMVLLMKLSSFCWNVADGQLPADQLSDYQKDRMLKEVPSVLDYAAWVLFFPSLMAGPAFDYADYRRWIDTTMFDVPAEVDPAKKPPVRKKRKIPRSGTPATRKAAAGLIWLGLFVYFGASYNPEFLSSDTFLKYNVFQRVWLNYVTNVVARFKYYAVWSLSEGACILAGMGYNGFDPVTAKVSWNRLQNIDPWQVEFAQNPRGYLAGWNMNTNNWLRNSVYLRVTPRGKKPGFRASLITFATSALWHGFYPGYYLTFVLASLIQTVAKHFRRLVRPFFLDPVTGHARPTKKYYDFASYLVTQITFSFATTPFLTLTLPASLHVWSALYFYGLIWTLGALAFFSSPGKAWLRKKLESRQGKANAKLVRTVSSESITSMEPILGISKDPEADISEAVEQLKAEIEVKRRELAEQKQKKKV